MVIFEDHELQERYDGIVDRDLGKIFHEFTIRCKRERIAMLPRFSGKSGLSLLKERAQKKGYVLGTKIHLQQGMDVADISTIEFVAEPTISIRRGEVYVDGEKRQKWEKLKNPMLCGFGVEMCLLGWSKFSGMTCTDIASKLRDGAGIEEIIAKATIGKMRKAVSQKTTATVEYNGAAMPIKEALEAACVPYFEYVGKMRGVDEICRQSVFDELAERYKDGARRGVMRHFGRIWLSVSEDDFSIVQSIAKHRSIPEQEALHLLVNDGGY